MTEILVLKLDFTEETKKTGFGTKLALMKDIARKQAAKRCERPVNSGPFPA